MIDPALTEHLSKAMAEMHSLGLFKLEHELISAQGPRIELKDGSLAINLASNNYLGLCNHPAIIDAASKSLHEYGFGLASVRFISGTQQIHRELEKKLSSFLKTEDTLLYSSCFDANSGLFETLFDEKDAIISDELNHASIIDGIRLSKAMRLRYKNNDLRDLESKLIEAKLARYKIIATDAIFSMDGLMADLKGICDLADRYKALVMVDDCHGVGALGKDGRGTPEYLGVLGRIDILTGTLGKALGGASGGYTSGKKEIISWLRQKSRPYLFSNTLAPCIAGASIKAIELVQNEAHLREKLLASTLFFRREMTKMGFPLIKGQHPIIPVMLQKASLAQTFAKKMLEQGVYVIGFFYPVVPEGKARIRVQISAAHSKEDLDAALLAFKKVGKELYII